MIQFLLTQIAKIKAAIALKQNDIRTVFINREEVSKTGEITVPTSSRHIVTFTSNGTAAFWIGYVFVSSQGAVSVAEISKGNDLTVTTDTNKLLWSTSLARAFMISDEIIYGDACS